MPESESKGASLTVRLPGALKLELEDAAYAEDIPLAAIVLEGINLALAPIRAKHKGKIPPRPRRWSSADEPSTAASTEPAPDTKRRRKK